jgi:hypothetical protein
MADAVPILLFVRSGQVCVLRPVTVRARQARRSGCNIDDVATLKFFGESCA